MLNAEKYRDQILAMPNHHFGLCNGKVIECLDCACDCCDLCKGETCNRIEWLLAEYERHVPADTPFGTEIEVSDDEITWTSPRKFAAILNNMTYVVPLFVKDNTLIGYKYSRLKKG